MQKTITAFALTALLSTTWTSHSEDSQIILTSPLLKLIDGASFAIDGKTFSLMLKVRSDVRKRLFGTPVKGDSKNVGIYELRGQYYSIVELVEVEEKLEADYTSGIICESDYQALKKDMRDLLESAKSDFIKVTKEYSGGAQAFKSQTLKLIEESCQKRKNPNCFLLKWGEEKPGNEGILLKREIVTFKQFQKFCQDLADFLEDMLRSCPKAKKQFIELVKSLREKKEQTEE